MATTAIANREKMQTIRAFLSKENIRAAMSAVLPKHLTPERMLKVALISISRQPRLLQCTRESLLRSLMDAAQLGLEPNNLLGSSYLVPYKNSKTNQYEAQLQVGYRGLIDLARRSGQIISIEAHVVHEHDDFEVAFGLEPILRHKPNLTEDPGIPVFFYAVAHLRDGGVQADVMTMADVKRIQQRSKSANDGPWVTDFDEMGKKTVVRRLVKYLPVSVELSQALEIEERSESDEPFIDLDALPGMDGGDGNEENGEQNKSSGSRTDAIKERLIAGSSKLQAGQSDPLPSGEGQDLVSSESVRDVRELAAYLGASPLLLSWGNEVTLDQYTHTLAYLERVMQLRTTAQQQGYMAEVDGVLARSHAAGQRVSDDALEDVARNLAARAKGEVA